MKNKKKIIIGISVISLFLVVAVGITYSLWTKTFSQSGENKLASDCFHIVFDEVKGSGINLENAYPIYDLEGKKLTPYEFTLTNTCQVPVEYQINLETTINTTMKDEYVKFMFQEEEPVLLNTLDKTDKTLKNGLAAYFLEKGYLTASETKSYRIRIWMDEQVTQNDEGAMNSIFESKVTVIGKYLTKYVEPILDGTDPVLKDGLIPVTIDNNGVVRKANERKEWYNYEKKNWANAVILNDESVSYSNEEIIPESNIESYFVWIPKYRYQLWDLGEYEGVTTVDNTKIHEIPIIFGDYDTQDKDGECKTPMLSGESGNCKVGDYMTHPAFISMESTGLWVGKFETGYKGSTSILTSESNTNEPDKVQIKPNVNSWRNIQVANAFYSSYDYKRDFDSHMMKNTEWGSVAYLQHSKYGSTSSVRINNNEGYVTGYAAVREPTCGYTGGNEDCNINGFGENVNQSWNVEVGYLASTTGNISGVYDMSGGAWDYVMGIMNDSNGNPMSGRNSIYNSGFNGTFGCPTCDNDTSGLIELTNGKSFDIASRYYDKYVYSESNGGYVRRILGDATSELGSFVTITYDTLENTISSWYDDESNFVFNLLPYFARGGDRYRGLGAGIFTFDATRGNKSPYYSFRIVLSV